MRVVVIQTAFIGDVVLTTPLFGALRRLDPAVVIDVVATPQGCQMLSGLGNVRCHALDKKTKGLRQGISDVLSSLKTDSAPVDVVICVHRSLRSLWLGRQIPAYRRVAFRSFWARALGYETASYPPFDEAVHYAHKPLELAKLLGHKPAGRPRPELAVSEAARQKFQVSGPGQGEYIVVSPFSVWGTKMWFADRFARLGAELSRTQRLPVVLVGTGGPLPGSVPPVLESAVSASIARKIEQAGGRAIDLVGKTSLEDLKAVIASARLVVANDSAPVHVAAAFDVPTVAIFGPTVKKWGFFPLSSKAVVVERSGLSCRPCHVHGPQRCPKGHFRCMEEIRVEDVVKAVETLIADGR